MECSRGNSMRHFNLFLFALALLLAGCGGGGSSGIAGTKGGGGTTGSGGLKNATAKIHVDVLTRQVIITPLSGATNNKIFQGNTIGFNASLLLDQPGDTGRKALNVSLVNHSGEAIGQDPSGNVSGLRVVFGAFTNLSSIPDQRPFTKVSTIAGTGTSGATDGPALSATFNGTWNSASGSDGSLYVSDLINNKIRKLSGGYVTTFAGSGAPGSTDGLGAGATFTQPEGIAINPIDGSLIVADFGDNKIRRITTAGRVYTIAGTGAYGGTNGTGNVSTFSSPGSVWVD